MFEVVRTLEESVFSSDFVAIGNLLNHEKESTHSAFVIRYQNKLHEFHYTSVFIEFQQGISDDYFHAVTATIPKGEVAAFIAYCRTIQKNANPDYGYFYSGEYYDLQGKHFSSQVLGERMTCVGFCLNVLKGFLEEEYLHYPDWDESTHDKPGYLQAYCQKYGLDPKLVKGAHRRITPRECLVSCFFKSLPIRKADIDRLQDQVQEIIEDKLNDSNP